MAVRELKNRPESMAHFPNDGRYRWVELFNDEGTYGVAAFAERGDALELHVTLTRWGACVVRSVRGDVNWLKKEAKRLGKARIMGVRVNGSGEFDPRLFKFARLFGFTDMCVLQTATITLDSE